ncbi:MAG: ribosome biogenesis GTPase Der [Fimbriimonadales bacterium]|nr:ribosome biogenesis GTPase Der [Fimbriimonadales bacterium]
MQRKPVLAIVGRPNVGKSTLFNRLVGQRVAIVEDTPGVTRDRLYGEGEWLGQPFVVIDTGGILFGDDDPLIEQVRVQAQVAIHEADCILFLVDARDGLTPADEEVAELLRKGKKPVVLLVNKADNPKLWENQRAEFFALGLGEPIPVSSIHGHNIAEVLERAFEQIPAAPAPAADTDAEGQEPVKIAIVGRPNVGKSSLLNAILGEPRAIVSPIAGTTRDTLDTPFTWKDQPVILIDTAGIKRPGKVQRSLEYYAQLRAERAMQRADVAVVVIDAAEGITHNDRRIAQLAASAGRGVVWAVNKWDLKEPPDGNLEQRTPLKKDFERLIQQDVKWLDYAPFVFISALAGAGIERLLDTCMVVADFHCMRVGTGELNRLIQEWLFERPYTRKGKQLKIYYATMASVRPPTIVLFVNDPKIVHFSYLRYLENQLRSRYEYTGVPIRWVIRAAHEEREK